MKFASSFAAFSGLALGAFSLTTPLGIRETFVPSWKVEVFPGGETVVLNGTIQEVRAELLKLNPDWDKHYPRAEKTADDLSTLQKRNIFTGAGGNGYFCGGRWAWASTSAIRDGIEYLRQVNGQPYADGGPSRCGRVSCSWQAAIWWCNDDPEPKVLGSFGDIADGAEFILANCARPWDPVGSGQVFHQDSWNVVVARDRDKC